MINSSSLRVAHTQAYPVRFPLLGRAFLDRDYNVALLQGQTLLEVGHNYFTYNRAWRASQQIYSHSVVVWWRSTWVVQLFILQLALPPDEEQTQIEEGLLQLFTYFLELDSALDFKISYDQLKDKDLPFTKRTHLTPNHRAEKFFPHLIVASPTKVIKKRPPVILVRSGFYRPFRWWVTRNELTWVTQFYPRHKFHETSTYRSYLDRKGRQRFDKRVIPVKFARLTGRFQRVYTEVLRDQTEERIQLFFSRFVRVMRPRQQWRPYTLLSQALTTEYQQVIKNRVRFVWRLIQHPSEGGINLWLGWLALRINQRGTYHTRRIAYPLLGWAQEEQIEFKGFSLRCGGRFTRAQRADYKIIRFGRCTNPANLRQRVDQVFFTFPLKFGAIGLTLRVNF